MITVMMGDQDGTHRSAGNGSVQRSQMGGVIGTGIDDGDVGIPHDIALRSRERKGRGIGSEHAGDQRLKQDRNAGRVLSHCGACGQAASKGQPLHPLTGAGVEFGVKS